MKILLTCVLFLFLVSACMTVGKGVVHTVDKGETLYRIATAYGVDPQDLAEANDIKDPKELKAGTRLFIPGAKEKKKVKPLPPNHAAQPVEKKKDLNYAVSPPREDRIVVDKKRFSWPVSGPVESPFGMRNGTRHDGIDIKAPEGTPVKAADDGRAVYVSTMRGYGNMIIIKHRNDFYTVYAHNRKNLVKDGDKVSRGDVIALVGDTGNAKGCHLHFEVREGKKVRNPLFFLP
ncbi:MAG: M23 family metallopeptidase [Deltaproteobacteria bacterium]|nr:M23 family metallopeptidase [Deltaproteobacteria bacterium]